MGEVQLRHCERAVGAAASMDRAEKTSDDFMVALERSDEAAERRWIWRETWGRRTHNRPPASHPGAIDIYLKPLPSGPLQILGRRVENFGRIISGGDRGHPDY